MTPFSGSPRPNSIVCPYKVFFDKNSVISVGDAPYHLSINVRSPISTSIVRAQWVRKRSRRWREERRREWPRGAFSEEGISSVEVERRLGFLVEGSGWQWSSLARVGDCG